MSVGGKRMNWLVTGGAGYIGAHVVRVLQDRGETVTVVDDLSTGEPSRLDPDVGLTIATVQDTQQLERVMRTQQIDGVVHLAGLKAVAESVRNPLDYYRHNVQGLHSVLTAMLHTGVPRILFSSSAAVYGRAPSGRVTETSPVEPMSPYGWTKLAAERLLRDTAVAHGIDWAVLRYFNVGGAISPSLADRGEDNLLPRLLRAAETGEVFEVYGLHHPTPDGTCVRDYVHVADVADAHGCVLDNLRRGPVGEVYNIGRGCGASVLEVIDAVRTSTGRPLRWRAVAARPGDPAEVVADPSRIRDQLGWSAGRDLLAITTSAWEARVLSGASPRTSGC
jgi:UDP-glucose 4-epimerase